MIQKSIDFKKALFFVCCLTMLFHASTYAQYNRPENNVWIFGNNMGVDFNTASPSLVSTPFIQNTITYAQESGASVCDALGQILFCTDGEKVWDKNGNMMPNGDIKSQFQNSGEMTWSVSQNALIVPVPHSTSKYYVFSITQNGYFFALPGYLYYSVVDMNLHNGLGDIVQNKKAIPLNAAEIAGERIVAIPGKDCNVWVLATQMNGYKFTAYDVRDTGINTTPVLSTSAIPFAVQGCFAASKDGHSFALTSYPDNVSMLKGVSKFDFNPSTGVVSNGTYLDSIHNYYGVCFSPDDSKLYATTWSQDSGRLYQFNLSAPVPAASQTLIAQSALAGDLGTYLGGIKLAANGKMYVNNSSVRLDVVNFPNTAGTACQYTGAVLALPNGTSVNFSTTVVFSTLKDTVYTNTDSLICSGWQNGITISAGVTGAGYNYTWNTGAATGNIAVTASGIYWVRYSDGCNVHVDSFHLNGSDIAAAITENNFTLSVTGGPFTTYQWLLDGNVITGATAATYNIAANGHYTVIVTNAAGCTFTAPAFTVTDWKGTGIDNLTLLAERIHIYPNPASDMVYIDSPVPVKAILTGVEGRQLFAGTNRFSLKSIAAGIYLLRITDNKDNLIKVAKIIKQ